MRVFFFLRHYFMHKENCGKQEVDRCWRENVSKVLLFLFCMHFVIGYLLHTDMCLFVFFKNILFWQGYKGIVKFSQVKTAFLLDLRWWFYTTYLMFAFFMETSSHLAEWLYFALEQVRGVELKNICELRELRDVNTMEMWAWIYVVFGNDKPLDLFPNCDSFLSDNEWTKACGMIFFKCWHFKAFSEFSLLCACFTLWHTNTFRAYTIVYCTVHVNVACSKECATIYVLLALKNIHEFREITTGDNFRNSRTKRTKQAYNSQSVYLASQCFCYINILGALKDPDFWNAHPIRERWASL